MAPGVAGLCGWKTNDSFRQGLSVYHDILQLNKKGHRTICYWREEQVAQIWWISLDKPFAMFTDAYLQVVKTSTVQGPVVRKPINLIQD